MGRRSGHAYGGRLLFCLDNVDDGGDAANHPSDARASRGRSGHHRVSALDAERDGACRDAGLLGQGWGRRSRCTAGGLRHPPDAAGQRIQIAAEIIEMSAQVLLRAPRLLTVPLASFGWWLLLTVWWVYVSALLNTAGQIHDGDVQFPKGSHIHVTYADSSGSLGQMAWATLFGYLWTSSFLAAFAYMSIAFVSVAWYFSAPGAAKSVPEGAVGRSIEITWRYHLGTLAIGSLLLSMVQALRLFFRVVEQQCRKLRDSNRLWQSVVNCIHCCLGCMERGVQLVDQTAYVVTCIEGTGFCASAGTGVQLVYHNVARVGTAAVVVDAVLYLVKFSITGVNALLAWGLMTRVDYFKVDDGAKFPGLILVAIITYMTSCFFVGVFHTVVDAVFAMFPGRRARQQWQGAAILHAARTSGANSTPQPTHRHKGGPLTSMICTR
eukprot:TRINITY_DN14441_c0_g1_i1.p1 TRINITY_DN14441_c0_g1~~TRINITY_DN14441_c0_g1_i1.p1  ORF type:complete len:437 (+),score=34.44 TRINITY_DN14441_c0_g1_i1:548-1858(+)